MPVIFDQSVALKLNKYLYGLKCSNQKFFHYFSGILRDFGLERVIELNQVVNYLSETGP